MTNLRARLDFGGCSSSGSQNAYVALLGTQRNVEGRKSAPAPSIMGLFGRALTSIKTAPTLAHLKELKPF